MAFTLLQLRGFVRDHVAIDPADATLTDATLTSLINSALRTFATSHEWDWHKTNETLTYTPGVMLATPSATWRKSARLVDVTNGDARTLTPVTPAMADGRVTTVRSTPAVWCVEGGQIRVVPGPDTTRTMTHYYYRTEPTLSLDADTCLTPDWALDLVIIRAAKAVAVRLDLISQLYNNLGREEQAIMASLEDDLTRSRPPVQIQRRRDWTL